MPLILQRRTSQEHNKSRIWRFALTIDLCWFGKVVRKIMKQLNNAKIHGSWVSVLMSLFFPTRATRFYRHSSMRSAATSQDLQFNLWWCSFSFEFWVNTSKFESSRWRACNAVLSTESISILDQSKTQQKCQQDQWSCHDRNLRANKTQAAHEQEQHWG